MKKTLYTIFTVLFIFLSVNTSFSQLKIILGPAIGFTSPSGDYGGSTTEYYAGTKYGLSSGVNFGAMGKLGLGPINFNLSIIYSPLSNSGVADANQNNSSVEIKQNLLTIGVGSQFGFGIPLAPVKPYIGFDILFTSISGETTFKSISGAPSSPIEMETANRTGLGIAGGVEIKLFSTTIDASLRYNMINLFSKNYEGSASGPRWDSYKFLNDAKDPNSGANNHIVSSDRTISTISFQLGVLFGF